MKNAKVEYYKELARSITLKEDESRALVGSSFLKKLGMDSNQLHGKLLVNTVVEDAYRQLSYYRQRKEDLIARMATDWPRWGTGLDFYTFFIKPLMHNPLLLHFINLSDGIGLSQTTIKYGYCDDDSKIKYVSKKLVWEENNSKGDNSKKPVDADLLDMTLLPMLEKLDGRSVRIEAEGLESALVRVRDADIGVQAFFSFIEGILRNAAKHRPARTQDDQLELRIVLCKTVKEARGLVGNDIKLPDDNKYCYAILSTYHDVLFHEGQLRTVKGTDGNDVNLLQYLRSELIRPIIDNNTGKVAEGGWGMKELKICAAFVSGAELEEVNSPEPNYVWVTKCPDQLWDTDKKQRFAWVLRLEKPRYVLGVVSEKPNNASEWEDKGVKFVLPEELANTNRDYDFLYIDSNVQPSAVAWQGVKGLPQRQVVDSLKWESMKDPMDFLYGVYDKHLESLVGNKEKQYSLIFYFDDQNKSNQWTQWLEKAPNIPTLVTVHAPESASGARDNRDGDASKKICIFRHIRAGENVGFSRCEKDNRLIYQQYASYADPFFSFLYSIDPAQLGPLIVRQVLESATMNVLIIDERVAQVALTRQVPDASETIRLDQALYWTGIYVASSVKFNGNKKPLQFLDESEVHNSRLITVDLHKLIEGDLDLESPDGKPIENRRTVEPFKVDVLLIHATKLKEIAQVLGKNGEDVIDDLKKQCKHVIVHSGRGKTKGDIPRNAPFLEYSIIQRYVIQEPSKFYLMQIALSTQEDVE